MNYSAQSCHRLTDIGIAPKNRRFDSNFKPLELSSFWEFLSKSRHWLPVGSAIRKLWNAIIGVFCINDRKFLRIRKECDGLLEDPFDQDDWGSWTEFTKALAEEKGNEVQVVGNDLTVINPTNDRSEGLQLFAAKIESNWNCLGKHPSCETCARSQMGSHDKSLQRSDDRYIYRRFGCGIAYRAD